jgi:hypothetical protein
MLSKNQSNEIEQSAANSWNEINHPESVSRWKTLNDRMTLVEWLVPTFEKPEIWNWALKAPGTENLEQIILYNMK